MASIDKVVAAIQNNQTLPQDNRRWVLVELVPTGSQMHRHNLSWEDVYQLMAEWGARSHLKLHEEQRVPAVAAPSPAAPEAPGSQSQNLFE